MAKKALLYVITMLLVGCSHDFDPSESPDAWDNDEMGMSEFDGGPKKIPDQFIPDLSNTGDAVPPQTCDPVTNGATKDCTKVDSWECIDKKCEDYSRMACTASDKKTSELRCSSTGACFCILPNSKTPLPCLGLPQNGRSGCNRLREAFLHGCCAP